MPVLGSGHPQADVMLLKYAPTAAEVEEGVAFYGRSGNALMKSFKRLSIDPIVVFGTLCVKCPLTDPSEAADPCVERIAEEIAIVQPRIIVVMGDGEINEGSVWESAMFAAAQRLENVCVVVDYNKWQATARSNETLMLAPLVDKWRAFGWDAQEIDGHDIGKLAAFMSNIPNGSGKPVALIAHTVKGKGFEFMEDDNNWHYRAPTAEEVVKARKELGLE